MPTYDYRCNGCGHLFEHFQAISDPLLRKCPECGKPKLERLIGAGAGFLFKGAGFYITDYRSDSYQAAAKKESGATAPATGEKKGESAKSESAKSEGAKSGSETGAKGGEKSSEKTAAPAPSKASDAKPAPSRTKPSKPR